MITVNPVRVNWSHAMKLSRAVVSLINDVVGLVQDVDVIRQLVGCQHAPDRCRDAIVDGDTATAQRHAMCARAKARFALCFTFTSQIKITQRTRLEFCDSARKMSQAIYFGSTDNILVNFLRSLALCTFQCMQQWHGCSCS